jgi:hypothetical protein
MNSRKLEPQRQFQCERFYQMVVDQHESASDLVFDLAQCFMEGFDIEKLRALLNSENEGVVADGIFILNEVGGFPEELAPEVRRLLSHHDPFIKGRAETLARAYPDIIGPPDSP